MSAFHERRRWFLAIKESGGPLNGKRPWPEIRVEIPGGVGPFPNPVEDPWQGVVRADLPALRGAGAALGALYGLESSRPRAATM